MSDETTDQGNLAYEDRPGWSKRWVLQSGADRAEWNVPEGRIGGLVRQQRRRAHIAAQRGRWLFSLLFTVIAIGLGYYVGLPIWQQVQDASKRSLEAEARLLESQKSQFDTGRNAAWADVIASLRFVFRPESFEFTASVGSFTVTNNQTRLLTVLEDGTIAYTDTAGDVWIRPEIQGFFASWRQPLAAIQKFDDDARLIAFSNSSEQNQKGFISDRLAFPSLVSADGGTTWAASFLPADIPQGLGSERLFQSNGVSIRRLGNTFARTGDYGASWRSVPIKANADQDLNIRQVGENALAARTTGVDVAFSQDAGKTWTDLVVPGTPNAAYVIDRIEDAQIFIVVVTRRDLSLLSDPMTRNFVSNDGGKSWENYIPDNTLPAPVVIVEDPSPEFVFDLDEGGFEVTSSGAQILVRRLDPTTGQSTTVFALNGEGSDRGYLVTDGQTIALMPYRKFNDTLAFAGTADGGKTWREYPSLPNEIDLFVTTDVVKSIDGTKALAFDDFGTFAKLDDFYFQILNGVNLDDAQTGDAQARNHIAALPAELREDPAFRPRVAALESAIQDAAKGRAAIDAERDAKLAEASEIGGTGFSLSQRRRDYQQFMEVCRAGSTDTTNCTDGYIKLREAEKDTIWQFVAERAPQAVLLLFLLATLGGLYRYNLRLIGFHHSRADALEMLSVLHGDGAKLSKDDLVAFTGFADQMAADKVEFGKSSTPTDQAVELARIISQRS